MLSFMAMNLMGFWKETEKNLKVVIMTLLKTGQTPEAIAELTGLSIDELHALIDG
jgi:hypothetical protein